jgi:hypothetical protein
MKTMLITQTGFVIGGRAGLILWDGTRGEIEMKECYLAYHDTTPKNILRCVNDNGFGCEYIECADIDIYIKYDNGSKEYDRTLYVDHPIHTRHFLGWRELQEQGIKV